MSRRGGLEATHEMLADAPVFLHLWSCPPQAGFALNFPVFLFSCFPAQQLCQMPYVGLVLPGPGPMLHLGQADTGLCAERSSLHHLASKLSCPYLATTMYFSGLRAPKNAGGMQPEQLDKQHMQGCILLGFVTGASIVQSAELASCHLSLCRCHPACRSNLSLPSSAGIISTL